MGTHLYVSNRYLDKWLRWGRLDPGQRGRVKAARMRGMQAAAMQLGLTVVVEEREDGAAGGRGEGIFELISAGDAAAMQEVTSYATKPPEKVQSPTSVTRAA